MRLSNLIEVNLSVPYKKGMRVKTANKIAEWIDRNSDSYLNVRKLKSVLNDESEYWVESPVKISSLKRWQDKEVDPKKAVASKGSVVVLGDGEIIDGRHRVAALANKGKTTVGAWVPVKK